MRTTLLLAAMATVLAAAGCSAYEEDEHRGAVEAYAGGDVDWGLYLRGADSGEGVCDADDVAVFAAAYHAESGSWGPLVLDVHYRCPERMGELAGVLGEYDV